MLEGLTQPAPAKAPQTQAAGSRTALGRGHRVTRGPRATMAGPAAGEYSMRLLGTQEDPASLLGLGDLQISGPKGTEPSACSIVGAAAPLPEAPGARPFDFGAFQARLETQRLGGTLLHAGQLPSTQALLQENPGRLPDGTVCLADRQVAGKGRGRNSWESPAGCLMFSLLTKLGIPGEVLPFVQYVVSLAVVDAVGDAFRARLGAGASPLRIKWPNDLYWEGLKLGGLLCQSCYRNKAFEVVVGLGLNLDNAQPTTCLAAILAAAHTERGRGEGQPQGALQPLLREELLALILNHIEAGLAELALRGFGPLRERYLAAWLHTGQQVTLEEGGRSVAVTVEGLTPHGYLLATDAAGERFELHPDGNSLDFFRGLVRKKLPT